MLKAKIQEIKEKLNKDHKTIQSMKIYSNNVPVNEVISIINNKLPKGIRGAAIAVYFALEGHANSSCEVNTSQQTLANETGYSREYVNYIIGQLHSIGLIQRIRRGLKQVNQYILTVKKNIVEILSELKELYIQMQKEKREQQQKNYNNKPSTFNNFKQRNYDFEDLEKKLLGWEDELQLE
jgi:predicted transcriptional regulator